MLGRAVWVPPMSDLIDGTRLPKRRWYLSDEVDVLCKLHISQQIYKVLAFFMGVCSIQGGTYFIVLGGKYPHKNINQQKRVMNCVSQREPYA